MRIYLWILLVAIVAVVAILTIGWQFLPGFIVSRDLGESLFVEALSFVVTTAVIGSLSAAVVRYLERRKAVPMLGYVTAKIENNLLEGLISYVDLLRLGERPIIRYRLPIATMAADVARYGVHRHEKNVFHLSRARRHWQAAMKAIDRYMAVFPVEDQDELSILLDILEDKLIALDDPAEALGLARLHDDAALSERDPETWRQFATAVEVALAPKYRYAAGNLWKQQRSDALLRREMPLLLRELDLMWAGMLFSASYVAGNFKVTGYARSVLGELARRPEFQVDFDEVLPDAEAGILTRIDAAEFGIDEGVYELASLVDSVSRETFDRLLARAGVTRADVFSRPEREA